MKILLKRIIDAFHVLKSRGPLNLIKIVINQIQDRNFDKKYKIDTSFCEDPRDYVQDHVVSKATLYVPTRVRSFKKLLSKLSINYSGRFVDYGCGKGRVLILAAEAGFKHVVGIEFVPEWAKLSEHNLQGSKYSSINFEILNIDAQLYEPTKEDSFFYFYDPFGDGILIPCLKTINRSFAGHNRKGHVVILNNLRTDWTPVIQTMTEFTSQVIEVGGERFLVFESK